MNPTESSLLLVLTLWTCAGSPGLACLQTIPPSTLPVTTSTVPAASTTTSTGTFAMTTTPISTPMTVNDCGTCTEDQIIFSVGDTQVPQLQIDTFGTMFASQHYKFMTQPNGCVTMQATCSAEDNFTAYMQFNFNEGGPSPDDTGVKPQTISVPLQCKNGLWNYVFLETSGVVREVSCQQAKNA